MAQPVRNLNSADYKFGYNGKEKDDEIKGSGNSVDFGARMLDTRVGRWYATDRFEEKFPSVSTYSYADNSPIMKIDIGGDWPWIANQNMISGYMNSLGFLNKKFTLMDMNSFGHKHIHRQLSSFYQVWNDKNSGHYAPVIAKFLKEESIPVVIGKIKNDENGFINWGYTVGTEYIVLDKVIFKG
ncbi:MAG: RHS repeat domain-containing protein, partial [Candidatus Kapaibacterium sp.]